MNAIERQMTVVSVPVVEMNVGHIHASVTLVILEMASSAITSMTLPVLRSGQTTVV